MRSRALAVLPLLLLATTAACVADVGTGKVAAEVTEASGPAATAEVERVVQVDTASSRVHVLGAKITATHDIEFDAWQGALQLDKAGGLVGLEVTLQMDSVRADATRLTAHLKRDDFFWVERYPTATFRSTSVVAKAGPEGATHEVTGDLTLRGVTRRLTFPATVQTHGEALHAWAEFVVNRHDFDITLRGAPDDLIQDNVVLTIDLKTS